MQSCRAISGVLLGLTACMADLPELAKPVDPTRVGARMT